MPTKPASALRTMAAAAATAILTAAAPAFFVPRTMSAAITNPYFPLYPGERMEYGGLEDGHFIREVVTVQKQPMIVAGAPALVVRDVVYQNGQLVEDTYHWYSQDPTGNVWYLGEDAKSMRQGRVVSTAGSWKTGVKGARAGIIMEARASVRDSYQQESYGHVAQDRAQVLAINVQRQVPYGRFKHVVCTKEWSPLETAAAEVKCYAPRVGLISERSLENGATALTLRSVVR